MSNAATTAGALKALIEGGGLSLSAYRDVAPQGQNLPYVVIHEEIANVPGLAEDGVPDVTAETVQIDLWQMWRKADRTMNENYSLARSLIALLAGAALPTSPTRAYYVKVVDSQRLLEENVEVKDRTSGTPDSITGYGLVHHAITVRVDRKLT